MGAPEECDLTDATSCQLLLPGSICRPGEPHYCGNCRTNADCQVKPYLPGPNEKPYHCSPDGLCQPFVCSDEVCQSGWQTEEEKKRWYCDPATQDCARGCGQNRDCPFRTPVCDLATHKCDYEQPCAPAAKARCDANCRAGPCDSLCNCGG